MSKKKVLTLSTQYANNMGALLQCYALSRFLNQQEDVECKIIQYWHPNAKAGWGFFKKNNNLKTLLSNVYRLCRPDLLWLKHKRNEAARAFIQEYLPLDDALYMSDQSIHDNPPQADAYVVGSDQIWNVKRKGIGTVYFLDFVPEGKRRIAYAPSLGVEWTEEECQRLKPYLQQFDALSVREEGHVAQVARTAGKPVAHVCDPVFLLSREDWLSVAHRPAISEPYIFCYFFGVSDLALQTVKRLKELTGYKVVYLNFNATDKLHSDVEMRVGGPLDFLGLIANATMVCTSSFHCSALSILFRKDFFYVPQVASERVLSLMRKYKIDKILMTKERLQGLRKEDLHIDYSGGEADGDEYIQFSKNYLINAIYGKENA